MAIRKRLAPADRKFEPHEFIGNKYWTAEEKAKLANAFVRFVRSGFPEPQFTKFLYGHLSNMFHNIAHYNLNGFYGAQFETTAKRLRFLKNCVEYPHYGSPDHTRVDVEVALDNWIRENNIIGIWTVKAVEEERAREVAERDRLNTKYPLAG